MGDAMLIDEMALRAMILKLLRQGYAVMVDHGNWLFMLPDGRWWPIEAMILDEIKAFDLD
jgi:hypothetical protein